MLLMSHAGYRATTDRVHRAISELPARDLLQERAGANRPELVARNRTAAGKLAGDLEGPLGMHRAFAQVWAVVRWTVNTRSHNTKRDLPAAFGRWWCRSWCSSQPHNHYITWPLLTFNGVGPGSPPQAVSQTARSLLQRPPVALRSG